MQILVPFGPIVTEVCCHKINMNTKEKDIIKRILNKETCLAALLVAYGKYLNGVL